ncbi:MAG: PBP1A family penicillin-binding protein [Firmicutes bacterium]|nr:PBP1A family penicillin-binding protein [Bacillota bacterium]
MDEMRKPEVGKEGWAVWKRHWRLLRQKVLLAVTITLLVVLCLPVPPPEQPVTSRVLSADGEVISLLYRENRELAKLSEIPLFLQQAFLAVEDHRFYQHNGFSPVSFARALYHNLFVREGLQGFSTITQQVAKNCYLSAERTLIRKLKELFLALRLELHYSKEEILELYLNQIYFGHGAFGVKTAARTYFGRPLAALNRAELAMLAGLPKGPGLYSPYLNREAANRRLQTVLARMVAVGVLSAAEKEEILQEPLRLPGLAKTPRHALYFLDYALEEVSRILNISKEQIQNLGLTIETTLSLPVQKAAEETLQTRLAPLQKDQQPQGALVAADPASGAIKALVGGTDYYKTPFNRSTNAFRQPGSTFKPFVYLAALEAGYTLATTIPCRAVSFSTTEHEAYQPRDYGRQPYHNRDLTLREALAASCNIVAVTLHQRLGLKPTINMARRLGITTALPENLSLALGTSEVSPFELLQAYLPMANGGKAVPLHTVQRIYNTEGKMIWERKPRPRQVIDERLAFLITSVLQDATGPNGTAASVQATLQRPVAGKTGTSQGNRDAWFVGFTPDLAAVVYVGDDQNKPLPAGGGSLAAPLWAAFMQKALAATPVRDFTIPAGIVTRRICRETGLLATADCPGENEYFLYGSEPTVYCARHRKIRLRVCQKTGLLPNPNCPRVEEKTFVWGDHPAATCEACQAPANLWELIFGQPFPLFKGSNEKE